MKPKILIVDDDPKLCRLLETFLTPYGFDVKSAQHPTAGLRSLADHPPDLLILDVMLPERNGFDLLREIRKSSGIPVIMLTARGELTDRVVGLEMGADDYLPKPFEPRELVARIQSVLRRAKGSDTKAPAVMRFGTLMIDLKRHQVTLDDLPLELTTNEFAVLRLLAMHPGEVLDRDRILDTLRGMECEAFNRSVDITVSRLRQKLNDDPKAPRFIRTVWGTGYMFVAEDSAGAA